MQKLRNTYTQVQQNLEELANGIICELEQEAEEYRIPKDVLLEVSKKIREYVSTDAKIKVVPAMVRNKTIRKSITSSKKAYKKHSWIEFNEDSEYTVDFVLEQGFPITPKNSNCILWSYNDGECKPITESDRSVIIYHGYRLQ